MLNATKTDYVQIFYQTPGNDATPNAAEQLRSNRRSPTGVTTAVHLHLFSRPPHSPSSMFPNCRQHQVLKLREVVAPVTTSPLRTFQPQTIRKQSMSLQVVVDRSLPHHSPVIHGKSLSCPTGIDERRSIPICARTRRRSLVAVDST